ncbi:hypothetical protein SAMN00808754_0440 [Thermanaeromonas toyohensis ToBE]|uniref:Glycosyl transferase family 2 n=1 Tax=Thermanaeromonas toyohensis ToBE TaxID=698762 RepID=A0A1W1VDM9_9FIRM|nr:hypothetical protein [Thermanaeromonas toyohensis]SMB91426.1 hypothetical protein SAMN00808754_0440 [Thermanaeromonas toyohensis ToBE]
MALVVWYIVIFFLFMVMFWNFISLARVGKVKHRLLLLVQDQEEAIEGILRAILWWRSLKGCWLELVVIDCGSQDNTYRILERFNFPYPICTVHYIPRGKEEEEDLVGFQNYLQGPYKLLTWDLRDRLSGRLWFRQISTWLEKDMVF